jgi:ubiquinone/menaquinone biosynthesis C-methylase UbiE
MAEPKMNYPKTNRFQELFKEHKYLAFKNYLYNYLLRKRAVEKCLRHERPDLMLEVGSGISPLLTDIGHVVYSDVSFEAMNILKKTINNGHYVVADGTRLPFRSDSFSHTICSEVLEHIQDDRQALGELARILRKPNGSLIITVPHRKGYFGYDDLYVKHYRRYELAEIKERLQAAGLEPILIQKVLGPLEKITMLVVIRFFSLINRPHPSPRATGELLEGRLKNLPGVIFEWLNLFYKGYVWLDAKIMPLSLATVILIKSSSSKMS